MGRKKKYADEESKQFEVSIAATGTFKTCHECGGQYFVGMGVTWGYGVNIKGIRKGCCGYRCMRILQSKQAGGNIRHG